LGQANNVSPLSSGRELGGPTMAKDPFANQIDWITGLAGDDRAKAGSVVAWQCIATTINELVKRFNDISSGTTEPQFKRNCEVQLKKMIIGMIYELRDCFNQWTADLRKRGMFNDTLKSLKRAFEDSCEKVGLTQLKDIRNGVAFHFKESLTNPDAIVDLYTKIDEVPKETLSEIVIAAHECGYAMRDAIVKSLDTTV
jgi:hypothetical protein